MIPSEAMHVRRTCVLAAVAALAWPAAASAHLETGTVAVSERATILSPRSNAFTARVYASDLALHLTVSRGHTVVVDGYLGAPFLRIGPAGLTVDTGSATAAATGLHTKRRPDASSVTWHDARVRSPSWRIPIVVDGRRSVIAGETRRLPSPALWPWLVLLAGFAAPVVAAWRRRALAAGAIAFGAVSAVAAVATAAGFAFDSYASPGTWIAGVDETVFAAVAAAAIAWAPAAGRVAGAGGAGLVGVAVGVSKGAVFLHADVLSVLPGPVARLLAAVAIGAGGAAVVAAGVWFIQAAGVGFEPTEGVNPQQFSRLPRSTAPAPRRAGEP